MHSNISRNDSVGIWMQQYIKLNGFKIIVLHCIRKGSKIQFD